MVFVFRPSSFVRFASADKSPHPQRAELLHVPPFRVGAFGRSRVQLPHPVEVFIAFGELALVGKGSRYLLIVDARYINEYRRIGWAEQKGAFNIGSIVVL